MVQNTKGNDPILDLIVKSIQETKEGVNVLYDIVCKGHDGQQSLLTRITIIERSDKDKEERLSDIEKFQIQFKTESRKTQIHLFWLLIATIGVMSIAIVTNTANIERIKWLIDILR